MAEMTDRRLSLPARGELRRVSPWVWVLLTLAALRVAVSLVVEPAALSLDLLLAAMPAVAAAVLMFVAPRERLIRLAAFGWAVPVLVVAVRLVLPPLLAPTAISHDYGLLAERLIGWTDAAASVMWVLSLVAVLALAFYVGPIRTRLGWAVFAIGTLVTLAYAITVGGQMAPFLDPEVGGFTLPEFILRMLATLVFIAWSYFLAVAAERRMVLLVLAAAISLVNVALSVLSFALPAAASPGDSLAGVYVIGYLFLGLAIVHWLAFIGGTFFELPRHGRLAEEDSTVTHEAYSLGR